LNRAIIVDLDGTLTIDDKSLGYPDKPLDTVIGAAVEAARAQGMRIAVMTARGMRTYGNDRALVEQHVRPQVAEWLTRHGVPHDELIVAKPWCGQRGFYVDDRNLHVEEFAFRYTGPFAGRKVEVRVEGQVSATGHARIAAIERWLEVVAYRYDAPRDSLPRAMRDDDRVEPAPVDVDLVLRTAITGDPAAWFTACHHTIGAIGAIVHRGSFGLPPFDLLPAHNAAGVVLLETP
jgi:capsule biosynthesis phosphatase